MRFGKSFIVRFVVLQIMLVCWVQASTPLQRILTLPALAILIFIFLNGFLVRKSSISQHKFALKHLILILIVFGVMTVNIFSSNNKATMKQIMFGWDFVGHFGVFRWGLTHLHMFTSTEFASRNYIESYLDSNYPQTWALWGANYFRWIPQENFYIMKALLFFSLCTLLVAYLLFFSSYQELKIMSGNLFSKSTIGKPASIIAKVNYFDIAFAVTLLSFISFCWNTNCPHFALSTALIFRATLLSQNKFRSKSDDLDNSFLIFAAFILYPLTAIFSGLYLYNLYKKIFSKGIPIKKVLFSFQIFTNASILMGALSMIFVKADKSVKLETLIFSYGGVTFPSFILPGLILIGLIAVVHIKLGWAQTFQLALLSLPVLLLDFALIVRNKEISYYGAKSTIALIVIVFGLFVTFSTRKNLMNLNSKMLISSFAIAILFFVATFYSKLVPILDDINKRGIPMTLSRTFNSFELQKDWLDAGFVTMEAQKTQIDPTYKPLFTGGYPYLGNMWLAILGRYPSEIFAGTGDLISGELPIKLDYSNPIAFLSRNLDEKELILFRERFPYITVIDLED